MTVSGILKDATGKNSWNLTTGEITAPSLEVSITSAATSAANSYTDTKISAIPGQIESKVSEEINKFQIGGTQILTGTNIATELVTTSSWEAGTWMTTTADKSSEAGPPTSIEVTDAPNAYINVGWRLTNDSSRLNKSIMQKGVPLVIGDTYTVSCYARLVSGEAYIKAFPHWNNNNGWSLVDQTEAKKVTSTSWQRFVWTFRWHNWKDPEAGIGDREPIYIYFSLRNEGVSTNVGSIDICGMKLEAGSKVTDWSPAPEDYKTYVENNYSTITQTASQISTAVASVKSYTDDAVDNVQVGARNILLNTENSISWTGISLNASAYAVKDFYKTYLPVPSIFEVDDLVTVAFDWSTTATTGNFHVECGSVSPYVWGTVVSASGGRSATSNYVDISSSKTSGRFIVTFKITSSQTGATENLQWLRIRVDGDGWSGKTFTMSNAKAEWGNKATDWSPAPEDYKTYVENNYSTIKQTAS